MPMPAQNVDIQVRPVMNFRVVRMPDPSQDRAALEAFERQLDGLSRDGFGFLVGTETVLIFAKTVSLERIQVDTSRMVLPMGSPVA